VSLKWTRIIELAGVPMNMLDVSKARRHPSSFPSRKTSVRV
jgi:hypothetical protein